MRKIRHKTIRIPNGYELDLGQTYLFTTNPVGTKGLTSFRLYFKKVKDDDD